MLFLHHVFHSWRQPSTTNSPASKMSPSCFTSHAMGFLSLAKLLVMPSWWLWLHPRKGCTLTNSMLLRFACYQFGQLSRRFLPVMREVFFCQNQQHKITSPAHHLFRSWSNDIKWYPMELLHSSIWARRRNPWVNASIPTPWNTALRAIQPYISASGCSILGVAQHRIGDAKSRRVLGPFRRLPWAWAKIWK